MDIVLFPFDDYWWLYACFAGFVTLLLAMDLGIFHRKAHKVSFREAAIWSVIWVVLSLVFNYALYRYALWKFPLDARLSAIPGFNADQAAWQVALEFLTGYVVEKSLSVDNIFVFVLIFNYFAIPAIYQHRVLFYGIIGAFIFRAVFIALGSILLQYHWVVLLFGGFLIITGIKMLLMPREGIHPERNPLLRLFRRFVPVTNDFHGQHFFIREKGVWYATPLMVALLFVEFSDIIFAVDSVPAIFALTNEPLIVFTSNIFAILGLRALYFLLAGVVDKFYLLKPALALILMFVGLKMVWLNDLYGGKFPITFSLLIISVLVAGGVVFSLVFPTKTETERESLHISGS